ncbi:MAG: hypothetical protein RL757_695 [Bacteroidota bacterium]|jgi:hypothetical protein
MRQFVFEQKQKTFFIVLMAIGLLSMVWAFFHGDPSGDHNHTRFWTNFLHNSMFFTLISFTATFFLAATSVVLAGWHTVIKRVVEAQSLFLLGAMGLMGVLWVATMMNGHHMYHWADVEAVKADKVLQQKSAFLNKGWYSVAFAFLVLWTWFAFKFRSLSLAQDESTDKTYPFYSKLKFFSGMFMPIAGFTSAAAIWLWLMSVDAHWYSTMFAWYTTASGFVSMIAITILIVIYLKSKGYLQEVTLEHIHDLGKFLFAFSIFWTYLWFSQYMLIWYANNGEETVYFWQRLTKFPVLFYGNLVLNFALPFLILLRNDTKRKTGTLVFVACLVLFGHWWDYLQMAKIGPYIEAEEHRLHAEHAAHAGHDAHTKQLGDAHAQPAATHETPAAHAGGHDAHATPVGHDSAHATALAGHDSASHAPAHIGEAIASVGHGAAAEVEKPKINEGYFEYAPQLVDGIFVPGFAELGTFCFFAGLFLYLVFLQMSRASLIPGGDPYLDESLHHHVGYGGGHDEHDDHH